MTTYHLPLLLSWPQPSRRCKLRRPWLAAWLPAATASTTHGATATARHHALRRPRATNPSSPHSTHCCHGDHITHPRTSLIAPTQTPQRSSKRANWSTKQANWLCACAAAYRRARRASSSPGRRRRGGFLFPGMLCRSVRAEEEH